LAGSRRTLETSVPGSKGPDLDTLVSDKIAESTFTAGQQLYLVNPKRRTLFNIHVDPRDRSQSQILSLHPTEDGFAAELGPTVNSTAVPMTRKVKLTLTNASKSKLTGLAKLKGHDFAKVDTRDMKLKDIEVERTLSHSTRRKRSS
jgi:hypothetical protein